MNILFPTNTRDVINEIRGAVGRDVTFNTRSGEICSVCGVDPVTNTALNFACPVCSGVGYLYTYSGYTVSGHITYSPMEFMLWTTAGKTMIGDIRVQVEYTNALVTVLDNIVNVDVDGKKWTIKDKQYRGVPQINRIIIDLMEEV